MLQIQCIKSNILVKYLFNRFQMVPFCLEAERLEEAPAGDRVDSVVVEGVLPFTASVPHSVLMATLGMGMDVRSATARIQVSCTYTIENYVGKVRRVSYNLLHRLSIEHLRRM